MQRSLGPRNPLVAQTQQKEQGGGASSSASASARPGKTRHGSKHLGARLEAVASAALRPFSHYVHQTGARSPKRLTVLNDKVPAISSLPSPSLFSLADHGDGGLAVEAGQAGQSPAVLASACAEMQGGSSSLLEPTQSEGASGHGLPLPPTLVLPTLVPSIPHTVDGTSADLTLPPLDEDPDSPQALLPGLPDELARECLARLARDDHARAHHVSKEWDAYVEAQEFFEARKQHGVQEAWLYVLLRDKKDNLRWRALDPNTDTWHQVPDMPEGCRQGYGMACVSCGDRLFVIGGAEWYRTSKTEVWCYKPAAKQWSRVADLNTPRCYSLATVLKGQIYVVGGIGEQSGEGIPTMEVYNEEDDRWSYTAQLPTQRELENVAVLRDKLLVRPRAVADEDQMSTAAYVYIPKVDLWIGHNTEMTATWSGPSANLDGQLYRLAIHGNEAELFRCDEGAMKWILLGSVPLPSPTGPYKLMGMNGELFAVGKGGSTVVIRPPTLDMDLQAHTLPSCDLASDMVIGCVSVAV